jgi:hypothetical protein
MYVLPEAEGKTTHMVNYNKYYSSLSGLDFFTSVLRTSWSYRQLYRMLYQALLCIVFDSFLSFYFSGCLKFFPAYLASLPSSSSILNNIDKIQKMSNTTKISKTKIS